MKERIVWLIDDDTFQNRINNRTLSKVGEGLTIIEYTDAVVALENLNNVEQHPDYIFIDIEMPTMSGIEFIKHLRSRNLKIPVVVLSSSLNEEVAEELLDIPFVAKCIPKPLTPNDLSELI